MPAGLAAGAGGIMGRMSPVPRPGRGSQRRIARPAGNSASLIAVAVCVALLAGGCGGPGAAEPAQAPAVARPAGRVVSVGEQPEGAVADPITGVVAVAVRNPTTLVLVDGRTGVVTGRVPLSSHVRHLQLARPGGPVLVPLEGSGVLATVSLPDGRAVSQVPSGRSAHDATALPGGLVAVADEFGKGLVLVRNGRQVHRFTDITQPGGVAAVRDLVAAVDVHERVLAIYDTAPPAARAKLRAGNGPTHVIADRRGRLWVTDTRGNRLLTFTTQPRPRKLDAVAVPGTPYGIAYDGTRDRLWITLTARNEVVGFDISTDHPRELVRLATVRQPNAVAVDPNTGRVFVTGTEDGTLQLIDPPA